MLLGTGRKMRPVQGLDFGVRETQERLAGEKL
jgi:hypothetical protein